VEAVAGLANILRAIDKTIDLDSEGALQIADALRQRQLIAFPTVKPGKGNVDFVTFLTGFWDYEKSSYVLDKLSHGYSIGQRHCYEMGNRVKTDWASYFMGRTLDTITSVDLKNFSRYLAEPKENTEKKGRGGKRTKNLSPKSIQKIMQSGTTALSWAFREKMIAVDPGDGLLKYIGGSKKRGVLTPAEAKAVFSVRWPDRRAFVANLFSCTTGLRAGEVLALRESDLSSSPYLNITYSWSPIDGLKAPKNGEARTVPLLPEVRELLFDLLKKNPYSGEVEDPFIFYGKLPGKPLDEKVLLKSFKAACRDVGNNPAGWTLDRTAVEGNGSLWMIKGEKDAKGKLQRIWSNPLKIPDEENLIAFSKKGTSGGLPNKCIEVRYRRSLEEPKTPMVIEPEIRDVVFHSHRHYYIARMADKMAAEQLMRITGHKSLAVFEEYADHIISENLELAGATGAEVFGNILAFHKGA
jgi:integrase